MRLGATLAFAAVSGSYDLTDIRLRPILTRQGNRIRQQSDRVNRAACWAVTVRSGVAVHSSFRRTIGLVTAKSSVCTALSADEVTDRFARAKAAVCRRHVCVPLRRPCFVPYAIPAFGHFENPHDA